MAIPPTLGSLGVLLSIILPSLPILLLLVGVGLLLYGRHAKQRSILYVGLATLIGALGLFVAVGIWLNTRP